MEHDMDLDSGLEYMRSLLLKRIAMRLNDSDEHLNTSAIGEIVLRGRSFKTGFELAVEALNLYLIPVIIVVGLAGNVVSGLVFSCTHLRRLSSSLYLTGLSLADIGFLLALGVAWLDRVGVHWMTLTGWCQLMVYLTRVCACLSVWSVLGFTTERYIIVYHALRRDQLCTIQRAKTVIAIIFASTLVLYLYIFPTYTVIALGVKRTCAPKPEFYDIMTIMTSLDTLLSCVVPSLVILVLNAKIMYKLHQYQHSRLTRSCKSPMAGKAQWCTKRVVRASMSTTGSVRVKFSSKIEIPRGDESKQDEQLFARSTAYKDKRLLPPRSRSQLRTARMLLIVSSMFVLLNLPSHVMRIYAFLQHLFWDNIKMPRVQYNIHEFFSLFFFLNFAINFFVYSLCGKQFRLGLKRLCRRFRYKMRRCLCKNTPKHDRHANEAEGKRVKVEEVGSLNRLAGEGLLREGDKGM